MSLVQTPEGVAREVLRCEPWMEGTDGDFTACRFLSGQWPCADGEVRDLADLIRARDAAVAAKALREAADEVYGDERATGQHWHPLSAASWLRERADQIGEG